MPKVAISVVFALALLLSPINAFALIIGGEGNEPVDNPIWPKGTSTVFNNHSRIAWWEGGGFSRQDSYAEGRADTATLTFLLNDFAHIDAARKQIVILEGEGQSFWVKIHQKPEDQKRSRIDWRFCVPATNNKPSIDELMALIPEPINREPTTPQLHLYSAKIDWDILILPEGIEVIDKRPSSRGYSNADGNVLEGSVTDSATGQPLSATVTILSEEKLQSIVQLPHTLAATTAGQDGKWVIKNAPKGNLRIVVEAAGYAPRVADAIALDDQPSWNAYSTSLVKSSALSGVVTDNNGTPLADVSVRLIDVRLESGDQYVPPFRLAYKTDKEGRFEAAEIPACAMVVSVEEHMRPVGRHAITADAPRQNLKFRIPDGSAIKVKIDFAGHKQPYVYYVELKSKGLVGGEYRKTDYINGEGECTFENLASGTYVVQGIGVGSTKQWPTAPLTIQVDEAQSQDVTLKVK